MKRHFLFIVASLFACSSQTFAQQMQSWMLDKMPDDLEMEYALSALPPHLRAGATVYLLDPKKGYYLARQGTNGFSTFVNRTEFERGEFVQDTYAAIAYDSAGSKVYLQPFFDVASMRASGQYTAPQIRDTIVQRVLNGTYKTAARPGISYMLSPVFRTYQDGKIVNMVMPHYMFYAPGVDDHDIGGKWEMGSQQPFIAGITDLLDKSHSIFNYIIIPAGEMEKAKIIEENKGMMKKLAAYKSCLDVQSNVTMQHH